MSNILSDPKNIKSIVATAVAFSIDKIIFQQTDTKRSLVLAGSVGLGVYATSFVSPFLPNLTNMIASTSMYNANVIESRVLEIALGTGISYGMHTFMIKGEGGQVNIMNKLALISATDLISEYITDYITSQPLAYLI